MKPMGLIAGTASSEIGSLSSFIVVPLAIFMGRCYNGTVLPLIIDFTVLGIWPIFIDGPMIKKHARALQ